MSATLKAPRGTLDVLPGQTEKWQYIEQSARKTAGLFGFDEIRFPTFEYTELFQRGVGDETDVVQKEMYTFEDRGGRSVSLRPEGTASTVRALLQNGLHNDVLPRRLFYLISCFRGERPQAGRLREFHQFGAELFGAADPAADAEMISLAVAVFDALGLKKPRLEINSLGCPDCRARYLDALKTYFRQNQEGLCETCADRLERSPLRILDCKSESCRRIAASAPSVLDYICADCKAHFDGVNKWLQTLGVEFIVNPAIVRGLDYYTRTVFEFIDGQSGLTVCAGGRYDGLVSQLGGPSLPALGFGMGLERLLMVMEAQNAAFPQREQPKVFLASVGQEAGQKAALLTASLRAAGIAAECDIAGKSVKAQMKYADKIGALYAVVLGGDELAAGRAELKNLRDGTKKQIPLNEGFIEEINKNIEEIKKKIG